MKLVIYIFIILFAKDSFGQDDSTEKINMNQTLEYVHLKVNYPQIAKEEGWVGRAYVKFTVDTNGKVINPLIIGASGHSVLDKEAIRVISSIPKLKIKIENNKKENSEIVVSVPFDLDRTLASDEMKKQKEGNKFYNEGLKYFEAGNFVEAKNMYKKAFNLNPKDYDSIYNIGVTYLKLNQKDSACYFWDIMRFSADANDKKEAKTLIKKYCSN